MAFSKASNCFGSEASSFHWGLRNATRAERFVWLLYLASASPYWFTPLSIPSMASMNCL